MVLGACFWFYIQSIEGRNAIYATTVLMGVGGSVMLVTALSLISELIGHDKVRFQYTFLSWFLSEQL
jgi:Ca2+/Na+ antiporter